MTQARTQAERWFGRSLEELTLNTGSGLSRNIHWEESRNYYFQSTAGTAKLTCVLPADVRNHDTGGPYLIVQVASASTHTADIDDALGTTLANIPAGSVGLIWLTDNSTAVGTWEVHVSSASAAAVLS